MKKRIGRIQIFFGITMLCTLIGMVFTSLSYATGYYSLGEMNSIVLFEVIGTAIVLQIMNYILTVKIKKQWLTTLLNCMIPMSLIVCFSLLIGDRVEGIGFTVVTQFDAGHGGAEACYLSFVACGGFLLGAVLKIVESFLRTPEEKLDKIK